MTALGVVAVLVVVALGVLLRAIWGFGDGMVAVPLLAAVIGLDQGAPLMALLSGLIALGLLFERPELVERGAVLRLILGALLGVPLGVYVLVGLDPIWAHRVLGLILVVFGVVSLVRTRPREAPSKRHSGWLDLGFGLLAGASSAAFDIAGPPLLIYAGLRGWDPDELRVNLQAVLLPVAIVTAGGHGFAGLWTPQVLLLGAASLPIVALGLRFGPRLRVRLGTDRGRRWVYALITALGLIELVQTWL